jgi:hypothetical protein
MEIVRRWLVVVGLLGLGLARCGGGTTPAPNPSPDVSGAGGPEQQLVARDCHQSVPELALCSPSSARGSEAHARALADAANELAALRLPSGARPVSGDESTGALLGTPIAPLSQPQICSPALFESRYWIASGGAHAVWYWITKHPPFHTFLGSSGENAGNGPSEAGFSFPNQPGVDGRWLIVTVTAAGSGGSAIRADSFAAWRPSDGHIECPPPGGY